MAKKVFIIEDDDSIFDVMSIVLDSERYSVLRFDEKKEFITQIIETSPHLIIMDIHYKNLSAENMILQLRKNEQCVKIPLVISSGDANLDKICRKYKISGCLKKPFDMIALINIVKSNIL